MNRSDTPRRIELYDTTLRDGAQGFGVAFSLVDKLEITRMLDQLGIDFIEGGYPLSNPKDAAYFEKVRQLDLKHSRVCAFGMTRRKGVKPENDQGMQALVDAQSPIITIVGKTWDLHVTEVLRVTEQENLDMIADSVSYCAKQLAGRNGEVFYDAEHFFDGYRANRDYAMQTLRAALDAGAGRLVLCDTNGGSLPQWISQVCRQVQDELGQSAKLAIHTHNDSGLAVANALAAVEAGSVQVQGTINGIGERCGNVDLTTVAANLKLKMGYECLLPDSFKRLTETSRFVYAAANLNPAVNQPFVSHGAFAHKGGMHVHAVQRIAHSYEHIDPQQVGNTRRVLVSELSGASNIAATLGQKFGLADDKEMQRKVLLRVQDLEHQGYEFEAATASFELMVYDLLGRKPAFWELEHYRCVIARRDGETPTTEAIVKVSVNGETEHRVAEGDGPVNALDAAMRQCLDREYGPMLKRLHLKDYKVRVVNPTAESAAKVRVTVLFAVRPQDSEQTLDADQNEPTGVKFFSTIGVDENIVNASWQAVTDAFAYHLIESHADAANADS